MGQIQGSASDIVLKQDIVDLVYPVGSYYWSSISTNPTILFGGGTWVQVKDVFLYAAGDTAPTNVADYVGGEKEHTLKEEEMPRHRHNSEALWTGASAKGTKNTITGFPENSQGQYGISTEYTGGSQPFNILPPFITAFCWRRTA